MPSDFFKRLSQNPIQTMEAGQVYDLTKFLKRSIHVISGGPAAFQFSLDNVNWGSVTGFTSVENGVMAELPDWVSRVRLVTGNASVVKLTAFNPGESE